MGRKRKEIEAIHFFGPDSLFDKESSYSQIRLGRNGNFSNRASCSFKLGGKKWPTVEHYIQVRNRFNIENQFPNLFEKRI